jgi:Arc/MetJ-type ribon-helix-helix transcriptional regulator
LKEKLKNATFSIPVELLDGLKNIVKAGHARSINSAVREALELYSAEKGKENLKEEMKNASKDPLFLKDLDNSMDSFKTSDGETARLMPDW